MINKYADEMQLVCDVCGDETPAYDEDQFEMMVSEAKADGWVIARKDGTWHHTCSDCGKEESALAAARRKFGIN